MVPNMADATPNTEVVQADVIRTGAARHPAAGVALRGRDRDGGPAMLADLLEHFEDGLFIQTLVVSVFSKRKG